VHTQPIEYISLNRTLIRTLEYSAWMCYR